MATHSSILAWKIPWTEEPGGLWSMGSQRVGHDWSDLAQHSLPDPVSPHPCQIWCCRYFVFYLSCSGSYNSSVWFYVPLKANDIEHLFMCLLAICFSSSVKCLFVVFAHFLDVCFYFLLSFENSLCILDTTPLLNMYLANIFSDSIACLFIFIWVFTEQVFKFHEVQFTKFFLSWVVLLMSSLRTLSVVLHPLWRLAFFAKFGTFSFIISSNSLSALQCFSGRCATTIVRMLNLFYYCPTGSCLKFTISDLCHLYYWVHPTGFQISVTVFFSSTIYI